MPDELKQGELAGSPELTCYIHPGWSPRIRPASQRRDWMEASPERFAYRCLPLAIANSHGWEIGCPCGFEVFWDGGQGTESVTVRTDAGTDPARAPVSLFGMGTVTFHVEGLIRTSPGWNLWVGGPPNAAKDAIAPLSGVIETDWSPYSFTMNWRLTRPGQWVRFEQDEPFCFFFPIQRGDLERVSPQIRPFAEAPELEAAFVAWSKSRSQFQAEVARNPPSAPADKWQKLYYRGLKPDGAAGPPDHQAKLRVLPFEGAPCSHAKMLQTTAAPANTPNDLALRRRDWLLATMERQRALSPLAGGIPRVREISVENFLDYFYAPGRPVIIEDAIGDWPATSWTPADLRDRIGSAIIEYQGGRNQAADFELAKDRHRKTMKFDAFIDLVTGTSGNDAYITAYNSAANAQALKPLEADLGQLTFLNSKEGMLWIGPEGTFTPLHFDLTNNLLAQVIGAKDFILLPPSETSRLANSRHVFSDVHDLTDAKRLERYPQANDARRYAFRLEAGELLFIPIGWWHQVRAASFGVMLTYTNFIWPNDAFATFPEG